MKKYIKKSALMVAFFGLFTFGFMQVPPKCGSGQIDPENSYDGN